MNHAMANQATIPTSRKGQHEIDILESRLRKLEQQHQQVYSHILLSKRQNMTVEDENAPVSKETGLRKSLGDGTILQCKEINEIKLYGRLGIGYSKEVHLGRFRGEKVAVKHVSSVVRDVVSCLKRGKYWKTNDCFIYPNYKIMKEILLALQLDHPNLIKLLGFCVRSETTSKSIHQQGVISIVEVGNPVYLEQMRANWDWKRRLKVVRDIASLLDYLEHSPLGSLIISDWKLKQMYMVGDSIRLGDLDDISDIEPDCQNGKSCRIDTRGRNFDIQCIDGKCLGYNAKFNLKVFNEMILDKLLEGPPKELERDVLDLKDSINSLLTDARHIFHELDNMNGGNKSNNSFNWYRKSMLANS
ncbi:extracellular tyrosine-protein kinase PKDCC-like isoform X3 [Ptychodera flava]